MSRFIKHLWWPVAGINRTAPFRQQPPYSTVDAVNVRPDGAHQWRERGGSRPGIGLEIRDRVGTGPVRLLTKVGILTSTDTRVSKLALDARLNDRLILKSGSTNFGVDRIAGRRVFRGLNWRVESPSDFRFPSATVNRAEFQLRVLPNAGAVLNGTVKIHFWYDTTPTQDGYSAEITFTAGAYTSAIREYAGGVNINTDFAGMVWTDRPDEPGRLVIELNGTTCEFYYRNQLMQTVTLTNGAYGDDNGFENASSDGSIRVDQWNVEYLSGSPGIKSNQRRDLLVAVANGNLYYEDFSDSLIELVPADPFEDIQLCATDREQKLYIADYGASLAGTLVPYSGGPPLDTITDGAQDFVTAGVDTNYVIEIVDSDFSQNEVQKIERTAATVGGTWTFTFEGNTSSALNWNATATEITNAFAALGYTVSTSGSGSIVDPWLIEFQGNRAETNVQLLTTDDSNLSPAPPTSDLTVTTTQEAGNSATFNGSFTITGVTATTITFTPTYNPAIIPVGAVNVTYRLAKPPKVFDAVAKTITPHVADAGKGQVPAGARLVIGYRDRIVYAATDALPHVWYMSRQGDPNDWDYSQDDAGAAVFAQSSIAGQLADPITALINHSDECLIIGCYNSLWMLRGDPGLGGVIDQLSHKIGIVGCDAYCKTPDDMCVFMTSDGLYVMPSGCHGFPTSLSRERVPDELLGLTETREHVSLEFDTVHRGVHIFVTRQDGTEGNNWWFDWESKSFWRVQLQNDHEPFATHERTAWDDSIRVLVAGRDGWIRYFDRNFYTDDGSTLNSHVFIGPFGLGDDTDLIEGIMTELHATTSVDSGPVVAELYTGDSFESSVSAGLRDSFNWVTPGLNYANRPRARGMGMVLKLNGTTKWLMENMRAVFKSAGKLRKR